MCFFPFTNFWIQSSLLFYNCCVSNLVLFCLRKKLCFVKTHLWHPKKIWSLGLALMAGHQNGPNVLNKTPNIRLLSVSVCILCRQTFLKEVVRNSCVQRHTEEGIIHPLCEKFALQSIHFGWIAHMASVWHPAFRQSDSCVFFSVFLAPGIPFWWWFFSVVEWPHCAFISRCCCDGRFRMAVNGHREDCID